MLDTTSDVVLKLLNLMVAILFSLLNEILQFRSNHDRGILDSKTN